MAPSLRVLLDGQIERSRRIIEGAADLLGLTEEQRQITIPSGQEQWINRGGWALSYLARVGAIERTSRAHYLITDIGRKLLADHPDGITEKDLRALSGGIRMPRTPGRRSPPHLRLSLNPRPKRRPHWIRRSRSSQASLESTPRSPISSWSGSMPRSPPSSNRPCSISSSRWATAGPRGPPPERSFPVTAASTASSTRMRWACPGSTSRPNAMRPTTSSGAPAIQAFVGALAGNQANQGVFLTTSRFSAEARHYAEAVPTRVVLIDGDRLTRLMIRYGVGGVQVKRTIQVVEIDEDFFE